MSFEVSNDEVENSKEYAALVEATEAFESAFPGYERDAVTDREKAIADYWTDEGQNSGFDRGYESAFENENFLAVESLEELVAEIKHLIHRRDNLGISDINVEEFVLDYLKTQGVN